MLVIKAAAQKFLKKALQTSFCKNEGGAVMVMVGLAMISLLVSSATVIDVGSLYWEKRQVQNAADGAALAAVFDLAEGRSFSAAKATGAAYAAENLQGKNPKLTFSMIDDNVIKVEIETEPALFIGPVIGMNTAKVHAEASAVYGVADSATNLVPFIVPEFKIPQYTGAGNPGTFVFGDDRPLPGNSKGSAQLGYFWLTDFDGGSGGTPQYDDWIRNGYKGEVTVGESPNGTGMKTALKDALAYRLVKDANVVLPVYVSTSGQGHGGTYETVGFVEFHMNSFDLHGSPKSITGYFTTGTVTTGYSSGGGGDYGVMAIRLLN